MSNFPISPSDPSRDPENEPRIDAGVEPDADSEADRALADEDDSKLPHPPSTATEQLDEGVASETDEGPEQGTSPGAG